jgi:hypothetical protein
MAYEKQRISVKISAAIWRQAGGAIGVAKINGGWREEA